MVSTGTTVSKSIAFRAKNSLPDKKTNLFLFSHILTLFRQLVREAAWAAIEGNVCMETITVPKTSLHADVQAAVEKELGLGMYVLPTVPCSAKTLPHLSICSDKCKQYDIR
jgi:hypothetical protein